MTGYDDPMKLPIRGEDAPMAGTSPDALTEAEVVDTADVSPRAAGPDLSGKRVRAIPYNGGTTIIVDEVDFRNNNISGQKKCEWDFRRDNMTVPVGNGDSNTLTKEAADFLTKNYPTQFEYMSQ